MIDYLTYCQIRSLHDDQKLTAGQIARQLQLDKKTVHHWLRHPYRQHKRPNRASKLDTYKPQIKAWLEAHDFTAQQILQRLQAQGVQVGYTIVRMYVRSVRPKPIRAFLTLSFCPGECMQVDWGSWGFIPIGATRRRLSFFVAVLCYSRMMYLEFTLGQSQEHFLQCHQNALNFFQGVPESVTVDNCKTAVLSHPVGQSAQFNPRYLDFANHYGFKVRACGVRKSCPSDRGVVLELFRVTNLLALLLALEGCEICNSFSKRGLELEARVGIARFRAVFRSIFSHLQRNQA